MGLLDRFAKITGGTNSDKMGKAIEDMVSQAIMRRRSHERRWYDNNFFDDGYHFRVISKKTGRVIDTANRNTGYVERAIPRASRQIRGVSNLLFAAEPYPVVYPKRISMSEFSKVLDPKTQQEKPGPDYDQAVKQAKEVAQKQGIWLSNEWEDEQELPIKLIDGLLKAMKNSVSWVQVYSDTNKQKLITDIYDAFDVICFGEKDDEQKLPFITKAFARDFEEVKSDRRFSEEARSKLVADNRYATSEIKNAYMRARYGAKYGTDETNTIMQKETFIKEVLDEENWDQAVKLGSDTGAMEGKSKGDLIMRQIFSAGGVTLNDSYIDYDEYPLIPIRLEPGPLYQVPFIERFIPQNKSEDVIITRLEKFVNAMVVGIYQKRKGEDYEVSNIPGGQMLEYETTPATQMQMANPGNTPFNVIALMDKYIEEQGIAATLGQIPQGVKANSAIESLKQSEYANLKIPTLMLKQSIKRISERMLERASKDFLTPQEVSHTQDGEQQYFDVIGQRGYDLSQKVGKQLPEGIIPIDKKLHLRIEIEPGLGLTMEGKKEAMKSIITDLMALLDKGFVSPDALQQVLKKYLETYGYGSTEEFMEAMENGVTAGQMSDNQIKQMQIAIAQTLKDVGAVGPQADQKLVTASKLGTLQSLKDAGLIDKMGSNGQNALEANKTVLDDMVKIYKDSPPDVRRQVEEALGMQPSNAETISPTQADTLTKVKTAMQPTPVKTGNSSVN